MSPTATRNSAILEGNRNADSKTSALSQEGSATARRHRTHSLSEDVHVDELKHAGEAAKKLPFTAASQALEMQHDGRSRKAPAVQDMKSAENTPPATPHTD